MRLISAGSLVRAQSGPVSARAVSRELRLGKPSSRMCEFFYVYILQSSVDPRRFYTGLTEDLPKRLKDHNSGRVLHTSKSKPWGLKTYVAFSDRGRAAEFERYLKSSSGRAIREEASLNPLAYKRSHRRGERFGASPAETSN
jgi:putative endonuclease